ncbi:MAG: hypothetical protein AB1742_15175 [bacterium]
MESPSVDVKRKIRRAKALTLCLLAALCLAVFPVLHAADVSLEKHRDHSRALSYVMFLVPSKLFLEIFSMGFEQIISDYFWIKAITYSEQDMIKYSMILSEHEMHEMLEATERTGRERYRMYRFLELSTHFDPGFIYAYEFGGTMLAWNGYVELANVLLERGLSKNPDAYRLAYSLGFNHFFFNKDFNKAIEYFTLAHEISGGESVKPSFIATLHALAGDIDLGLKLLESLYNNASDPDTKEFYAERIRYFWVEKHLKSLNEAIDAYGRRFGKDPEKLEELVETGIINAIPQEPFGGAYAIDHADHTAANRPFKRLAPIARFMGEKKNLADYAPRYMHRHEHEHERH